MGSLKLERLPDRSPIKMTIVVSPEISRALVEYAEAYKEAYGQEEPVTQLVPAMLWAFLQSDREFLRSRRSRRGEG
jgi:hypothetical protein